MNGTQASLPNNNSEIDSSRAEDEITAASNSTATVLLAALTTTLSSTTTATNAASLTTLTWKNLTVEAWTAISVLAFIGLWVSLLSFFYWENDQLLVHLNFYKMAKRSDAKLRVKILQTFIFDAQLFLIDWSEQFIANYFLAISYWSLFKQYKFYINYSRF